MKIVQVELSNLGHPERMVCWIASVFKKKRIKEGMSVHLDGIDGIWEIIKMYSEQEHYEINKGWNNNI